MEKLRQKLAELERAHPTEQALKLADFDDAADEEELRHEKMDHGGPAGEDTDSDIVIDETTSENNGGIPAMEDVAEGYAHTSGSIQ